MATAKRAGRRSARPGRRGPARVYDLEVLLLSGPVTRAFAREHPVVARTIRMRGDQTLEQLHRAIFTAFGRDEDRDYEFQLGKGPMDPEGPRYVLPGAYDVSMDDGRPAAGRVTDTTLDALGLGPGRVFGYWFDFGTEWWHEVRVVAVARRPTGGRYPRVVRRVGANPPQHAEPDAPPAGPEITDVAAADAACLVAELHLKKGDYLKAVDAFTRAIEAAPTIDAFQGRARAYRALAELDERAGGALR